MYKKEIINFIIRHEVGEIVLTIYSSSTSNAYKGILQYPVNNKLKHESKTGSSPKEVFDLFIVYIEMNLPGPYTIHEYKNN
jgi:hypothetical protein